MSIPADTVPVGRLVTTEKIMGWVGVISDTQGKYIFSMDLLPGLIYFKNVPLEMMFLTPIEA